MSEDISVREIMGKRIAKLRYEQHMTQQELADIVGITRVHISRIESGKYSAGVDIIAKIVNALGARLEIKKKGKS